MSRRKLVGTFNSAMYMPPDVISTGNNTHTYRFDGGYILIAQEKTNVTYEVKIYERPARISKARPLHFKTVDDDDPLVCGRYVSWWNGEYDGSCIRLKGHSGHHYDGISCYDDDGDAVEHRRAA